jgi:exopolysaccharide production protein ExoQ
LLLLLVTLHPFQPPVAGNMAGISAVEIVATDPWRQISFTAIFLMAVIAAAWRRPVLLLQAVPLGIMALLGWCLLSAIWSDAGAVVFRRAILIAEVTTAALLGMAMLGPERAFSRLRLVLVIVLVVNWIAIPIIPTAVHLPGELDPKLVGNWRGLYDQKNVAGAVCALTVLQFLFPGMRERRWSDGVVIAAALVFLYFTRSKTSLALLPVAALFAAAYRAGWKNGLDRAVLAAIALLAIGGFATFLALNSEMIGRIMSDPDAFTGRTEIWKADLAYLKDHFFLGAGYASVFSTGLQSPLLPYLHGRNWVAQVSNSHNGYLDIFLGLGAIGFVLALTALLIQPFRKFWPLTHDRAKAGYFALFIFVVLHNFTEADFLAADGVLWLAFLMVLGAIRQPAPARAPVTALPGAARPAAAFAWQVQPRRS